MRGGRPKNQLIFGQKWSLRHLWCLRWKKSTTEQSQTSEEEKSNARRKHFLSQKFFFGCPRVSSDPSVAAVGWATTATSATATTATTATSTTTTTSTAPRRKEKEKIEKKKIVLHHVFKFRVNSVLEPYYLLPNNKDV